MAGFLLMQSTLTGVEETIQQISIMQGLKASVKAEQKLPFFETLTLIEAKADMLKRNNLKAETDPYTIWC